MYVVWMNPLWNPSPLEPAWTLGASLLFSLALLLECLFMTSFDSIFIMAKLGQKLSHPNKHLGHHDSNMLSKYIAFEKSIICARWQLSFWKKELFIIIILFAIFCVDDMLGGRMILTYILNLKFTASAFI